MDHALDVLLDAPGHWHFADTVGCCCFWARSNPV